MGPTAEDAPDRDPCLCLCLCHGHARARGRAQQDLRVGSVEYHAAREARWAHPAGCSVSRARRGRAEERTHRWTWS